MIYIDHGLEVEIKECVSSWGSLQTLLLSVEGSEAPHLHTTSHDPWTEHPLFSNCMQLLPKAAGFVQVELIQLFRKPFLLESPFITVVWPQKRGMSSNVDTKMDTSTWFVPHPPLRLEWIYRLAGLFFSHPSWGTSYWIQLSINKWQVVLVEQDKEQWESRSS